jgi:hypothetical protein
MSESDPNNVDVTHDAVVSRPAKPSKPRQLVVADIVQLDPRYAAQNHGVKRALQYALTRNGPRHGTGIRNLHGRAILPASDRLAAQETEITWPVVAVGRWVDRPGDVLIPLPTPAEVSASMLSIVPASATFLDSLCMTPDDAPKICVGDFVLYQSGRKRRLWVVTRVAGANNTPPDLVYGRRVSAETGKTIEKEFPIAVAVVKMVTRDSAPAPVSGANSNTCACVRETDDGVEVSR